MAMVTTPVGRRLIGFLAIYNSADSERLQTFIAENYEDKALDSRSVNEWLKDYTEFYSEAGKLRVFQIVAMDEHYMVALMQSQANGGLYLNEVRVSADYPHKLEKHVHRPMNEEMNL
jgi:hypothetical protein